MSFRIVTIAKGAKLTLRQSYMVVDQEERTLIHIKEIGVLILESQRITLTVPLLNELINCNVSLIICDKNHNPNIQCLGLKSHSRRSKQIKKQLNWGEIEKDIVWQKIIQQKIRGQALLIREDDFETFKKMLDYIPQVTPGDRTNREGHAAKVYFNKVFHEGFTRQDDCSINAALNYGYQIILACINRHVVAKGYLTELGIFHRSEYNPFNLSSDLIEPYRPLIDRLVKENIQDKFEKKERDLIVEFLNERIMIDGKRQRIINSIPIYVDSVFKAIEQLTFEEILFPSEISDGG